MEAGAEHPRARRLSDPASSRLLVGIDLGTTNSAVAWVDRSRPPSRMRPSSFGIVQLAAVGETTARTTLPSFLYIPTPEERDAGGLALPWDPSPELVAGVFARDHGSLVPMRQIGSAKSWLSNPAVDRRAAMLPWAAEGARKFSPVDASARLLAHIRDAWNDAHGRAGDSAWLQDQDVVLTVPASFDEEARELTVEAAAEAGLAHLTLLEEPLAALYAWIAAHPRELGLTLTSGQFLLVCDVGGGTTDFSLIRATTERGSIQFERAAIGDHLLLGGDNVDLALAALVERKLAGGGGAGARLTLTQRQILRRQCSAAKERLLGDAGGDRVAITVLGSGRAVVGGAMTADLTREDAVQTLGEFLPVVGCHERPERHSRTGLRELGLPYESDAAITRHLAAFLARAAGLAAAGTGSGAGHMHQGLIRPDAVLFNGGFFTPSIARERVLDTLAAWFGVRPTVLVNDAPEAAVAIGAAYYGGVRRRPAAAARLLVRAGSARSYYVAVHSADRGGVTDGVCVMPRRTQEGTRLTLDREFIVITNQPAAFTLLSSTIRSDSLNDVVSFTETDDVHRHVPLVTALRYGRRSRQVPLKVRLDVMFTEVGTLELWCQSITTEHRWRLQFNLRATESDDDPVEAAEDTGAADQVVISDDAIAKADDVLRQAFAVAPGGPSLESLTGELENTLGHGKHAWPLQVIRRLADTLLPLVGARRTSPRHEARWLNLTGFCMRPGFGTSLDAWRVSELRKVYASGLAFPKDTQCEVEWLVVWQRVSAGFSAGQQQELATRTGGLVGLAGRKAPHLNPQIEREAWRLLAGLERVGGTDRTRMGDELIARVKRDPRSASFLWAIGRLGARAPLYGPLNSVVSPPVAERWIDALLALKALTPDALAAVAQIAARTDDPVRDLSPEARESVVARLRGAGAAAEVVHAVREVIPVTQLSGARLFGETLPEGLRLT